MECSCEVERIDDQRCAERGMCGKEKDGAMMLGELIAVARECKGWSLRELEKRSGISNALISQIETGKVRDPGFTTVVALVDALGLTLDRAASGARSKLDALRAAEKRKAFGLTGGTPPAETQ